MSNFETTIVKVTEKVGPRPSWSTFDCVQSQAQKINTRCKKRLGSNLMLTLSVPFNITLLYMVDIVFIIVVIVPLSSLPYGKELKTKLKI